MWVARPPVFSAAEKQRIVLSVLRGEAPIAEIARRSKCSETSVAKWRDQFLAGGLQALQAGAGRGASARGGPLGRGLGQANRAPRAAPGCLRLLARGRLGVSWRRLG